ncbi:M24 family metallopeptidase [Treponema parvum]|uniref:M24 family metallopeptidase n=1 Tax=Treponema parvum TaxID=138851 RepID=UPI001AEBCB68|nr:Xaa-Pro peptidase family protein [Treponema parvum]
MNKDDLYQSRIDKVLEGMKKMKLDGLIVSDPKSIRYLTGIYNEPYERLFVLYLSADKNHVFFLNKLFNVDQKKIREVWTCDTDDVMKIMASNIAKNGLIGVDKVWPARFLIPLCELTPDAKFLLGSDCVDDARACKDAEEQRIMKEASRINDVCIERGAAFVREGVTEKEVAEYIEAQFKAEGASGTSFSTIVSFGKNAADPHHEPDDTVVKEGDCVLIDMGCVKDGYCSDMTRTFFYKTAPDKFTKIHDLVREANEKAEAIIRPGVLLCDIDAAARDHIAKAGYANYFTHRLGHFIGQTDHEQGDVSSSNKNPVKPGMIFSIEPGVYLPGEFGVRIEDLVLVTDTGCEVLNKVDKKWKILCKR